MHLVVLYEAYHDVQSLQHKIFQACAYIILPLVVIILKTFLHSLIFHSIGQRLEQILLCKLSGR